MKLLMTQRTQNMGGCVMDRKILLILFTIFSTLALSACGSSSSGGGGSAPGGGLATGGFTKTYAPDASLTTWTSPFTTNSRHYLIMYQASDINGSGNINAISFRVSAAVNTPVICDNVTIRMGQSSLTQITNTTFASQIENGAGSMQTVINDATITIPVTALDEYFSVPLSSPFNYNGVDNLLLEITRVPGCSAVVSFRTENAIGTNNILWTDIIASATGFGPNNDLFHAKFNFAGGDNAQVLGGVQNNFWPFSSETPRIQQLYLASEIDGSGPITSIGFQMNAISSAQTYTATIMMGHSILATLGNTFATNYSDAPVTVANAVTFSIPAGIPAGEWFWVPLPDSTFNYNGTDNLIVDIAVSVGSGDTDLRVTNVSANRRVGSSDHTSAIALGPLQIVHHVKFRFNGGTMDVITSGNTNFWIPMGAGSGGNNQYLYPAAYLGTGGTITKLAVRLDGVNPVSAADYAGYTITVGNTAVTALSGTYANNLTNATVVYSGTLSVPGTVVKGDWIEIPLSPGFNYDTTQNFVVQLSNPGGAFANFLEGNNTEPNSYLYTIGDSAATTGTVINGILDLRLTVQK